MPHIHKLFDFVVSIFIVNRGRVLLIRHKQYREWLPIGGHIELDEDPEQTLYREIEEESGLKVRILSKAPRIRHRGVKPLPNPDYMDVHRIRGPHSHVAFVYFGVSRSDKVRLHTREHHEYRWFRKNELADARFGIIRSIRFYARRALEAAASRKRAWLLVCFLFLSGSVWARPIQYAKVLEVKGRAMMMTERGDWTPLRPNTLLENGSRVRTDEGSFVEIAFDWKQEGVARLDERSVLRVQSAESRQIFLETGRLWFQREDEGAGPHAGRIDPASILTVRTPAGALEAGYTGFEIAADSAGVRIKVFEQGIHYSPAGAVSPARATRELPEGFRYQMSGGGAQTAPERLGYDDYVPWEAWLRFVYKRRDELGERLFLRS